MKRWTLIGVVCVALGACSTASKREAARERNTPEPAPDVSSIPDAVPRLEPPCRYGNPDDYEVDGQRYVVMRSARGYVQRGIASWYGREFHRRLTSCREPYDMYAMTAAHSTLPLPTYVEVTNLLNGRRAVVRVNDRGPFKDHRLIDLSFAAAYRLGIVGPGTAPVEVRAIDPTLPPALPGDAYRYVKADIPSISASVPTPVPTPMSAPVPAVAPPMPAMPDDGPEDRPDDREDGGDSVYLQVGAFAQRGNAERLRSRLLQNGVHAVRIEADEDLTHPIYRVRVGPVQDRAAALRLGRRLSLVGVSRPHVVME